MPESDYIAVNAVAISRFRFQALPVPETIGLRVETGNQNPLVIN
jgi:hypothetical protein